MVNNDSSHPDYDQFAPPPPPSNTDYRHARWPRFTEHPPSHSAHKHKMAAKTYTARRKSPDVLVVGVCSAGKSTLVRRLRDEGYNARACAQEHSYVPHLWQLSNPVTLVYLDATLPTIKARRKPTWGAEILHEQHHRLRDAREHCDLYIPTDNVSPEEVAQGVLAFLRSESRSNQQHRISETP